MPNGALILVEQQEGESAMGEFQNISPGERRSRKWKGKAEVVIKSHTQMSTNRKLRMYILAN